MSGYKHLSPVALKEMMADGDVNIADIRDPAAFDSGHIEGATRLDNSNAADYINQADKNVPLVVCCYHGNSSQSAAAFMSQQGFEDVYSLDGGFEGWRLAFPDTVAS